MKLLNNFFFIEQIRRRDDGAQYIVRFNPQNEIYGAHFPGQPITPGVCIIQTAKELLEDYLQSDLEICGAKNVKFLSVIVPEEGKSFTYEFSKLKVANDITALQVIVTSEDTIYAKLSFSCQKKD